MRIAAGVPPAHTDWCRSSWLSVIKRTAMFCYINEGKLRACGDYVLPGFGYGVVSTHKELNSLRQSPYLEGDGC